MSGVVIIGAGLAGARCAETLRALGFAGRVRIVGEEQTPPYERPALSKELLAGVRAPAELGLREHSWWAENGVELVLGARVESVDPRKRTAILGSGEELGWDALVIATGARARRLRMFDGLPGVHRLRSLADALRLRKEFRAGRGLAIVGAGFVGTEVASTASGLGMEVTVVDPQPPLGRVLGSEVSKLLAERYRALGVRVLENGVTGVARSGRGTTLTLDDGSGVACDTLLVAVGAEPASEMLGGEPSGIETDAAGRTSLPGIYACGDVASAWHPLFHRHIRVEHWTDAAAQGAAVAHAIAGEPPLQRPVPYFWSDQFGLRLQYVGHAPDWSSVELDGSLESFRAVYLSPEGRPLAALLANRPRELPELRRELAEAA